MAASAESPTVCGFSQCHLRQLLVMRTHWPHRDIENDRRTGMISALYGQVEQIADHQHLRLPPLEAASVHNTGNDHLKAVDAAHPSNRDEDPMACEQLNHEALDAWCPAGSTALHDKITHLPHLVPSAVEDWQASDA